MLTYKHLLERVWRERDKGDLRPMRIIVGKLRRKLGDDADSPTYISTEPQVGHRIPTQGGLDRWVARNSLSEERSYPEGHGRLPRTTPRAVNRRA